MSSNLSLFYYYLRRGNARVVTKLIVSTGADVDDCKRSILERAKSNTPRDTADLYMIPQDKPVPLNDVEPALGRLSISVLGRTPLPINASLQSILGPQPKKDCVHLVLVDRGIPLNVRFWIPSTGHQFNVDVRENDDEVSLLPAIKKDIPTSMDQANLVFYKTSYCNSEELNDTTEGQLLPNLNKLYTAFDDTPFSELPCVIVRQRERKHHLSWDLVERATKYRKLHDKAPSAMGASEYFSLQINRTERLFDYRRRMGDSQELPEKDLPPVEVLFDGFGKFLDVWRAAYLPGFEAEPVTIKMRNNVDVFADTMSQIYPDEGARRMEGLEKLNTIFRTVLYDSITPSEIPATASQMPITDGHSCYKDIPIVIVELKNESAGSTAMPIVELAGYYSRMVQYLAGTRAAVVRGSRLPTLGITVVGPAITFFGLAYVGSVVYVPLTTSLWCLPVEYGGSDRHQLYIAFHAASALLANIGLEAKRLTDGLPPEPLQRPFCPQISSLASYLDRSSSIDLEIIDTIQKSHYRNVYAASSSSGDLVIKLTYSYSPDLHAFCANLGYAPMLLAFERLPGGVFAIAMKRLEGKTLDSTSYISAELQNKWTRDLRAIVETTHEKDYVHGDLRPPNIFCVGDRIALLDFDWGGKVGEARYPHARLHPQLTTGRDMSNLEITKDDDNRVLRNTLKYLQEIVQASGSLPVQSSSLVPETRTPGSPLAIQADPTPSADVLSTTAEKESASIATHASPLPSSTRDTQRLDTTTVPTDSNLEDAEKMRKAGIKRGKRKAVVVSSDEEREPRARRKVKRRGKK